MSVGETYRTQCIESPDDLIIYDLLAIERIILNADIEGAHERDIEAELTKWFDSYPTLRLAVTVGNLQLKEVKQLYATIDAQARSQHVVDSFDPYAALEDVYHFLSDSLQKRIKKNPDS